MRVCPVRTVGVRPRHTGQSCVASRADSIPAVARDEKGVRRVNLDVIPEVGRPFSGADEVRCSWRVVDNPVTAGELAIPIGCVSYWHPAGCAAIILLPVGPCGNAAVTQAPDAIGEGII